VLSCANGGRGEAPGVSPSDQPATQYLYVSGLKGPVLFTPM